MFTVFKKEITNIYLDVLLWYVTSAQTKIAPFLQHVTHLFILKNIMFIKKKKKVCNKKYYFHKNKRYVINTELHIHYLIFLFIALVYFAQEYRAPNL